jgi:hypothetical protein
MMRLHLRILSFVSFVATMMALRIARAAPTIEITSVPPYAVDGFISGRVTGVDFTAYRVAPYIQIEGLGWYTKPTFTEPSVPINSEGVFTADVATGGIDNRATIYCVQLIPAGSSSPPANGMSRVPENSASVATACVHRYGRTFQFAGRHWAVKEAPVPVGPGANLFSDRMEDVFVDAMGRLHLTVNFHDGSWWATEVILLDSPRGYGTYAFQTLSRLDTLDSNLTFGAFTWDPYGDDASVPGWPNREIDFEDSRWGNPSDSTSAQEVVQPYTVAGNVHRYALPDLTADAALTRIFIWGPQSIEFVALRGHHSPFNYSQQDVIDRFVYAHDPAANHYVPTAGREAFRFNLWPNNVARSGSPPRPSGGQAVEVVIVNFGPVCTCLGDANKNRFANSSDFASVQANFGRPADPLTDLGDADCNGFINATDFAAVQANFGRPCP